MRSLGRYRTGIARIECTQGSRPGQETYENVRSQDVVGLSSGFVRDGALLAASTSVIKGVVTDSSGKPIRGAVISAKSGIKTISRFSQKDGKYEIAVAAGTYDVTAEAYGFDVEENIGGHGEGRRNKFQSWRRQISAWGALQVPNWKVFCPILRRRGC